MACPLQVLLVLGISWFLASRHGRLIGLAAITVALSVWAVVTLSSDALESSPAAYTRTGGGSGNSEASGRRWPGTGAGGGVTTSGLTTLGVLLCFAPVARVLGIGGGHRQN